jgi:hypothetical protein
VRIVMDPIGVLWNGVRTAGTDPSRVRKKRV